MNFMNFKVIAECSGNQRKMIVETTLTNWETLQRKKMLQQPISQWHIKVYADPAHRYKTWEFTLDRTSQRLWDVVGSRDSFQTSWWKNASKILDFLKIASRSGWITPKTLRRNVGGFACGLGSPTSLSINPMDHLTTAYNVTKINQVPTSSTTLEEHDAIRESQAQYIVQMSNNILWSIVIGMENCNKITSDYIWNGLEKCLGYFCFTWMLIEYCIKHLRNKIYRFTSTTTLFYYKISSMKRIIWFSG